jgi:hypothetical protein
VSCFVGVGQLDKVLSLSKHVDAGVHHPAFT